MDDQLQRLATAEEIQIAPERRNGELRRPVSIWVVRAGDDLYVRAAYGANQGWHGVARTSRRARISAGGVSRDVTVQDADPSVLDQVDAAYREKLQWVGASRRSRRGRVGVAQSAVGVGRDQGEEQVRGLAFEREVADLVDDEQAVALERNAQRSASSGAGGAAGSRFSASPSAYRPAREPLPSEPGRLVVCALVGRARRARGCSTPGDDRLETRVYAVKRYAYRLAHAARSARFATSIEQLVVGLAPVMGWDGSRAPRPSGRAYVASHPA